MKKLSKFLLIAIVIVTIAFAIFKVTNRKDIGISDKEIDWEIEYQGIEDAKSFDIDEEGHIYIAFSNNIKIVDIETNESEVIRNSDFNIYDIALYKENLIIATDNRIVEYDKEKNEFNELIINIPNRGVNRELEILVNENELFVAIGSNTNSGVVDNSNGEKDISSFQWTLNGRNYGDGKTGAFLEFGVSSSEGEVIEEGIISNASIIYYDFLTEDIKTYATGIRSVKGFDFDSNGDLISIVSGIEDIGNRAISNDKDYIYEIKEKHWYGWPDFTGGDPVSAARFSDGNNTVDKLIKNPPTEMPSGPLYQNSSIKALNGLAVDKEGKYLSEDMVIFADNNKNYIYKLDNNVKIDFIQLKENSYIEKIRIYDDGIYVLDSGVGELYKFSNKDLNIMNLPNIIWVFIIIFVLTIIIILILRLKDKEYNKR